jgi:hypothetical protein
MVRPAARALPLPAPPAPSPGAVGPAASLADRQTTIRLSLAKIVQRRKNGHCFHCNDMFTHGHKQVCKHLFVIEVADNTNDGDVSEAAVETTISIHALTCIRPRSDCTMQLAVDINGTRLMALLDSRSTHNFVDLEAVVCAGL